MIKPIQAIFIFLLLASSLTAQQSAAGLSFFDHIAALEGEPVRMTIKTDLKQLIKSKYDEVYLPAEVSYTDAAGKVLNWTVELRARGNARKEICYYPPLKIKFDKDDLNAQGLQTEYKSFKIVNQCRTGNPYSQLLFRELLAYRLFNAVSPYSFKVRLLHLTYLDTGRKERPVELYAFLIEDADELAGRHQGQLVDRERFGTHMVERAAYLDMAMFQYMIGNTDWAVGNLHNLELIKVPAFEKVLCIPYDFDYSGLVNAPYAVPSAQLPISAVTQRLYRGLKCSAEESEILLERYRVLEPALREVVETSPLLDKRTRQEAVFYLNDFFRELQSPLALRKELEK